jgi:hypothetical protein
MVEGRKATGGGGFGMRGGGGVKEARLYQPSLRREISISAALTGPEVFLPGFPHRNSFFSPDRVSFRQLFLLRSTFKNFSLS